MTIRYIQAQDTREQAEEWCAENHLAPIFLEVGPDGRVRGIATPDIDMLAGDLLERVKSL